MLWPAGRNFGLVGSNIQNIAYTELNGEKPSIGNLPNSAAFYGNTFANTNAVFIIAIKMSE